MLAGIELGGTKTVVAIADAEGGIAQQFRFPTTSPEQTLAQAIQWFDEGGVVKKLGVAAFGPISINKQRTDYGCMMATPKQGWAGFDIIAKLQAGLPSVSIALDTDVNAAALAEVQLGAARGHENAAYITIGTGIGAGFIAEGKVLHGALHSEFGHLRVSRHPEDAFDGVCPFHGDCLEGLASGTALTERWGRGGHEIPTDHPAWNIEAWYLAQGVLSILAIASPSRVIIGGGVSQAENFHEKVEKQLRELAGGYFPVLEEAKKYIVAPELGQNAGVQGALLLGKEA